MSLQEQRRARFEAYIRAKYPQNARIILEVLPGTTGYRWADTVQRLEDWNAALDSVVIELPPRIDADEVAEHFAIDEEGHDMAVGISQMVNGAIIACGAFIKAAGLKVKP